MAPVPASPTRLLLVDDHEVVRMGLRAVFNRIDTIEVVGEADSVASAVREAVRLQPAVVLLDLRLPDGTGVEACREIMGQCPGIQIIFLTSFADQDVVLSTMLAGSKRYLLKTIGGPALVEAIHAVVQGQSLFDQRGVLPALAGMECPIASAVSSGMALSPQKQRILPLIAEGKTNKEIAASLGISDKIVKSYLYNIFQKLQVTRRSQAAAMFVQQRIAGLMPR